MRFELPVQVAALEARDGYVSDISRGLRYRPELFGEPFQQLLQDVMKGPSHHAVGPGDGGLAPVASSPWSEGARELFAAFVSVQRQCPF